jgi:hypothetical protein
LGKLLYWLTSGGRLIVREAFDAGTIAGGKSAQEVIVPILLKTIREGATERWTTEELLTHVDWARARLAEHRDLAARGLIVLADGFGPKHEVHLGASHSATTPPQGNPPDRYEVAEAFSAGDQSSVLVSIELYLAVYAGDGHGTITLEMDEAGHPSGDPLVAWPIDVRLPPASHGSVIRLEPALRAELGAGRTYWVCLSASGSGSNIAWVSGAINLAPRKTIFAERTAGGSWRAAESTSGPGHALRVLATALEPSPSNIA